MLNTNQPIVKNQNDEKTTTYILCLPLVYSCGVNPDVCECVKNFEKGPELEDVNLTKKCDEYNDGLSHKEADEWLSGLEDCK